MLAADTTMPGMIWGKVSRSPHPHARIKGIDTSKAEALPGVKAVVTSRDVVDFPIDKSVMLGIEEQALDVPQRNGARQGAVPRPSARSSRGHHGSDRGTACALIEVDCEVLPWAIEIDDALKPDVRRSCMIL